MRAHPLAFVALAFVALVLASCHTDQKDLGTLQGIEQTSDPTQVVKVNVASTDVSAACGRLYQEHGAACLQLTESGDAATRATMRSCAVGDFRQAQAHLPPDADHLVATRGLAEAVRVDRDNNPDPSARAADIAALDGLATQLKGLPGGAPYGGYYASQNALNRVLTRAVPPGQACATLASARAGLPATAPDDLAPRLNDLRQQIDTVTRMRSCS